MDKLSPTPALLSCTCLALASLAGCKPAPEDTFTSGFSSLSETGDGDGDGEPIGDGDGEPPGDGDGEPTGDGDGDGEPTGDGDGDGELTGDGDGDGDPPEPTCDDGLHNQDETDVDCGGDTCDECEDGGACVEADDCDSGMCVGQQCVSGCLGDVECEYLNDDCNIGICNIGVCQAFPANEGDECATGEPCKANGQCQAGACVEEDLDCSGLDSDCSVGTCDLMTGECVIDAINEGMPCNDANGCSIAPYCIEGACEDPEGGAVFYEPFADNDAGWTLDTNWDIGPAVDGCGDPGADHSPTDDNGLAGVVIGGCAPQVTHPYYCLTSPPIDTAGLPSVWMTYYRDLYSDYMPYMKNTLEVWDGDAWVILFETLGSPAVNDASWTYFGYDVSAYANAGMQFRWCYNIQSGGVFARGSWNVDDVTISVSECNGGDL